MRKRVFARTIAIALCFLMGATTAPITVDAQAAREVKQAENDTTAKENLKALVQKIEYNTFDDVKEAVRVETESICGEKGQEEVFAKETLAGGTRSVTIKSYDTNKDGSPELFVLYKNKKLEVYEYTEKMVVNGKSVKPLLTMKNVREVRKGSTAKGTFFIKQTKGGKSTYTTCSYTAGSVKKGKTISAKKFKKQKKLKLEVPFMSRDWLYSRAQFAITDKNLAIKSATFGENENISDGRIIVRRDEDPGMPRYRIFGEIYKEYDFRLVLGQDEEKDFNAFFKKHMSMSKHIPALHGILDDDPTYVVTGYTPANDNDNGYYSVALRDEDGSEADYFMRFYTEKAGDDTRLERIEMVESTGLIPGRVLFYYGDAVWDFDGEAYTPGLDMECFPTEQFLNQTENLLLHTIKVAYPDRTAELKALSSVRFIPFTATGNFSFDMDGTTVKAPTFLFASKELSFLNPKTETGYGDAPVVVNWKPSEGN